MLEIVSSGMLNEWSDTFLEGRERHEEVRSRRRFSSGRYIRRVRGNHVSGTGRQLDRDQLLQTIDL
jgi:hypothetical protein